MQITYNLNEIDKPVSCLREMLVERKIDYPVILLTGEMGAGKTTFTSHLVRSFNESLNPNSPTFNLMNEYRTSEFSIFHFDLYRLKSSEEVDNLGFEEIWGKQGLSIVEWWQIATDYFDKSAIEVKLEVVDEQRRRFTVK
ncbi:MAG: tRNA (adenosine(37)-N6)-threonylcarbamoyltransferase complex ATPase subunit type 1 TsaE [Leptospiraceae bacterium]|nr:tRNA (adenosine(37)-N6)-threonylcarbamoyltransferase complex ATPase subunit type 1 TsaE [Leptospiraceae bacterium]MBK7055641.1 tRNA (adenosine(37)-N6)-threonylcarbamoyltransferase complex ATPase subunit type 1 TsaE [Leptospiraceae bacterium]MBK9502218.1 tRNA (adenosine(37)-N6)-threonylcarbamoyltransferase complex ATPase subunit type 1 TsaE [Leptospiraceae bacterium]